MFFEIPSWDVSKEATELNDGLFKAKPDLSNKKKVHRLKTTNGQSSPSLGKQKEMVEGRPKMKGKGNFAEHLTDALDANSLGLKKSNKRNKYLDFGISSNTISALKTEITKDSNFSEENSPHANAKMVKHDNETKDNTINLSSKKKRKLKASLIANESLVENDQASSRSSTISPVKKRKISEEICQKAAKDVQKKNSVNMTTSEIAPQDNDISSANVPDKKTGVTEKTSNKRKKKKEIASDADINRHEISSPSLSKKMKMNKKIVLPGDISISSIKQEDSSDIPKQKRKKKCRKNKFKPRDLSTEDDGYIVSEASQVVIGGVAEDATQQSKMKTNGKKKEKKSVQNKSIHVVDNGSQILSEKSGSSSKKKKKLNQEEKKEVMLIGEHDGHSCTKKSVENKKLKKSKLKEGAVSEGPDDSLCASPIVNVTNSDRNKHDTSQNSVLKRETVSRNKQLKKAKQEKVQTDSGIENKTNHSSNSLPFTPKKISQMLAKMQKTPEFDAGNIGENAQRKVRMEISSINEAKVKNKKLKKVPNIDVKTSHNSELNMKPVKNSKTITPKGGPQQKSLLQKNLEKLEGGRFRFINEQLYVRTGEEAFQLFKEDPYAFEVYHKGFQNQVDKWPVNPLDVIIDYIKSKPPNKVIADFGCGDARLAQSVPNKVHSFDLVAVNNQVTVCDISKVPLTNETIDTAVFCLSLMGTNFTEFLKEANRVLKRGGILVIAEVASRFRKVKEFVSNIEKMGFTSIEQDTENTMFVLLKFQKKANLKSEVVKQMKLKPCMYKKR